MTTVYMEKTQFYQFNIINTHYPDTNCRRNAYKIKYIQHYTPRRP